MSYSLDHSITIAKFGFPVNCIFPYISVVTVDAKTTLNTAPNLSLAITISPSFISVDAIASTVVNSNADFSAVSSV